MDIRQREDTVRRAVAYFAAGLLTCSVTAAAFANQPAGPRKLNILFVMADDLNTALSGYGHPQCKTPNLDRLAASGVSFTRAYCQFPLCGPSRASLMTGQYPLANGVTGNGRAIRANTVTLPELFRRNGYWTGRVSKIYHMGVPGHIFTGDNGTDHEASWIERYNVSAMETLSPGLAKDLMLEDTVDQYEGLREKWLKVRHQGGRFLIPTGNHQGSDFVVIEADGGDDAMADGMAANKALQLLQQRAQQQQPFFLAVGFVRPHVPLVAPRDAFQGYVADQMTLATVPPDDLEDIPAPAKRNTNAARFRMTPDDQQEVLRGYYASVSYMDRQVGRLLDELKRLKLRDSTIVVFLSDHGYHLGEHTMWQKMSLMEESTRVPLIVSVPGDYATNACCNRIVESLDVYPTLAELAGLQLPAGVQGVSFASLLQDPESPATRQDALIQVGKAFCLRTDRWAYMEYPPGDTNAMLYDMQSDPRQFSNLVGNADYDVIERELQQRLALRRDQAKRNGPADD